MNSWWCGRSRVWFGRIGSRSDSLGSVAGTASQVASTKGCGADRAKRGLATELNQEYTKSVFSSLLGTSGFRIRSAADPPPGVVRRLYLLPNTGLWHHDHGYIAA